MIIKRSTFNLFFTILVIQCMYNSIKVLMLIKIKKNKKKFKKK